MKTKSLIQIFLFLTAIIISSFTVYFYFYKNENLRSEFNPKKSADNDTYSLKKIHSDIPSSILKNVMYENFDSNGNKYKIKAVSAEIIKQIKITDSIKKSATLIYMIDVTAKIYLKNLSFITITSDEAIFDNENFETNFSKNVRLNYLDHQLNGEELNLLFNKNLITMENQVVYKNSSTELNADRIVIDLITKNSKIFMNNNNKKIKIFNNN